MDFSADRLYSVFHIYLLIGVGLYFTVRTTFVQVRLLPSMFESIGGSRSKPRAESPRSRHSASVWHLGWVRETSPA
ncbi:hypothetical protein [Rhodococcus sp. 14-2496-1d]|uniref:hypothetical protein n=1 Tax=Rhodococcus sp. 14-2496-1d TaxID=2023146 RepID=UPI00359C6A18